MTVEGIYYFNKENVKLSSKPENTESSYTTVVIQPTAVDAKSTAVTETKNNDKAFDRKAVYDKYKDNPMEAVANIGYNFAKEQLDYIKKNIVNKDSLKTFLSIAEKDNLNAEDVIETYKQVIAQKKPSGFWGKIKNGVTSFFTGKSFHERKADEASENVSEIREVRGEEFSSKTVAKLGVQMTEDDSKEHIMHFVETKGAQGKFVYSEQNVTDAVEFITENPDEKDAFVKNAIELEGITNEKGEPKYSGDVIINVDKRMVRNPKLSDTMKIAAHKKDMTGEYLDKITDNLEQNPHMEESVRFSLTATNTKGEDRFSAKSVCDQSSHLAKQDERYCKTYSEILRNLAKHENLSSADIVTIANNITDHPEIADDIMSKINEGKMSGSEIAEYSTKCAESACDRRTVSSQNSASNTYTSENTIQDEAQNSSNSVNTSSFVTTNNQVTSNKTNQVSLNTTVDQNNIVPTITSCDVVKINGQEYTKSELKEALNTQFGYAMTDAVLDEIAKNPDFVNTLKKYGSSPDVVEKLLEDPSLVRKINNSCSSLTKNEFADIILLCNNKDNTQMVLSALENCSPANAIKTVKNAIVCNAGDDVRKILSDRTKNQLEKMREINEFWTVKRQDRSFNSVA